MEMHAYHDPYLASVGSKLVIRAHTARATCHLCACAWWLAAAAVAVVAGPPVSIGDSKVVLISRKQAGVPHDKSCTRSTASARPELGGVVHLGG